MVHVVSGSVNVRERHRPASPNLGPGRRRQGASRRRRLCRRGRKWRCCLRRTPPCRCTCDGRPGGSPWTRRRGCRGWPWSRRMTGGTGRDRCRESWPWLRELQPGLGGGNEGRRCRDRTARRGEVADWRRKWKQKQKMEATGVAQWGGKC
ncbi:hypothetical protein BO78DRAFT_151447 [Aspergillus sclerotiicarbonarius CBS 121057]|uniref:Uncharacterized protein n=1 Tax=Aspergillus sclerotiicarbonarius (strain CBS 121057 / IBT 28362) TaxID=1448318 RepID=A0A319EUT3_ASPSB|nr:hypothetical protein BO78DRAFT_151447 [Aspergillus sclerotiicarbonarius CBS 121057]